MALRAEVREWVESDLEPYVTEWDEAKRVPEEIYKQLGERGYLAGMLGMSYPTHLTKNVVKSVPPEKWDLFHEMLLTDELSRTGSGGLVWNLLGGFGIGCPPVAKYGKKALVDRILPGILSGDKRICLAITEPDAGSDVANLTCEAKLSEDGKHYSKLTMHLVLPGRTSSLTSPQSSMVRRSGSRTGFGVTISPLR